MMKVIRELIAKFAMKKGIALPFLLFLASAAFIISVLLILDDQSKTKNQNPTQSASPSPINDKTNWKIYKSGEQVENYDFSITYPPGWKFKIKETKIENSPEGFPRMLRFDIAPPEWGIDRGLDGSNLWGVLLIQVYPKSQSINSWIKSFHPILEEKPKIEYRKIGNKNAYVLLSVLDAFKNLPFFGAGYVVLGENYSYAISFSSEGREAGIRERLEKEIFPGFKFIDQPNEEKLCGTIAGIICPTGYECLYDGDYPDAGGKCVEK